MRNAQKIDRHLLNPLAVTSFLQLRASSFYLASSHSHLCFYTSKETALWNKPFHTSLGPSKHRYCSSTAWYLLPGICFKTQMQVNTLC